MHERQIEVNGPNRAAGHGASLGVGADEAVNLLGPGGQNLGVVRWALVAPYLEQDVEEGGERNQVPDSLVSRSARGVEVRYRTEDGTAHRGVVRWVGSSTLFIEGAPLVPAGTAVEVACRGAPDQEVSAEGTVMWVCPKQDQYGFAAGLGVWLSVNPGKLQQALADLDA